MIKIEKLCQISFLYNLKKSSEIITSTTYIKMDNQVINLIYVFNERLKMISTQYNELDILSSKINVLCLSYSDGSL